MATVLDLGLFEVLTPIIVWIFVFAILYAIFQKLGIFGEKPLSALIAAIFAFLFMIFANLRELITFFIPWVAVFFVLLIILLVAVMLLGFTQKDITGYLTDTPGITTAVVVIIIVLFFLGLNQVFPGSLGYPTDVSSSSGGIRKIIFDPRVLGVVLILVIASYVIKHVGFEK